MMSKTIKASLVAFSILGMTPLAAHAQWWQRHPAYLKAMSDLREAYWLVEFQDTANPLRKGEEMQAGRAIRAAYQSLKDASIVDGKDIEARPPADPTWGDRRGRLHKAMDLLHDAHEQVSHEEDDSAARGFKMRAIAQIDAAAHDTNAAMHAWNF